MNYGHEVLHHDLYDHLYDIYTSHKPREDQHLGYVDKSADTIHIALPLSHIDLSIQQLITALYSKTQTSSTGFVCWQVALHFADWVLASPQCPFRDRLSALTVLELGAGTSGLLAAVLGPQTRHYVASDQKHILKLLRANFAANVTSERYTVGRAGKDSWSRIDFIEFDWEQPEYGKSEFERVSDSFPDLILACDTVYNEYLLPHFVRAMKTMMGPQTLAVVAIQLRDEAVTEAFLETLFAENLRVYVVGDQHLTDELIHGFAVYCITT